MSKQTQALRGLKGISAEDFRGEAPQGVHCWPGLTRPAVAMYRGGATSKRISPINGEFVAKAGPGEGLNCVGHALGHVVPGLTDRDGQLQLPKGVAVALPPRLALELAVEISSNSSWPVGPASVVNPVTGKSRTGRQVIDLYVHPDDLGKLDAGNGHPTPGSLFEYLSQKAGWGGPMGDAKWLQALEVLTIKSTVDNSILHAPSNPDALSNDAEVERLQATVEALQARLEGALTTQTEVAELRALVDELAPLRGRLQQYSPDADEPGGIVLVTNPDGTPAASGVVPPEAKAKDKGSK